jgi:hypothetical protein
MQTKNNTDRLCKSINLVECFFPYRQDTYHRMLRCYSLNKSLIAQSYPDGQRVLKSEDACCGTVNGKSKNQNKLWKFEKRWIGDCMVRASQKVLERGHHDMQLSGYGTDKLCGYWKRNDHGVLADLVLFWNWYMGWSRYSTSIEAGNEDSYLYYSSYDWWFPLRQV